MELFKVKKQNGKQLKDCRHCIYYAETDYHRNPICKYHDRWLPTIQIKDSWICEYFKRKG